MNSGEGAGEVGLLLGCQPAVVPLEFICALKKMSACAWPERLWVVTWVKSGK